MYRPRHDSYLTKTRKFSQNYSKILKRTTKRPWHTFHLRFHLLISCNKPFSDNTRRQSWTDKDTIFGQNIFSPDYTWNFQAEYHKNIKNHCKMWILRKKYQGNHFYWSGETQACSFNPSHELNIYIVPNHFQDDRKFWTVWGRFIRIFDRKAKSFPNEEIMKRVDFSIFSSWHKQRTPQIGMNPTCIIFLMLGQKWPQRFRLSKFGLSLMRPFRAF